MQEGHRTDLACCIITKSYFKLKYQPQSLCLDKNSKEIKVKSLCAYMRTLYHRKHINTSDFSFASSPNVILGRSLVYFNLADF